MRLGNTRARRSAWATARWSSNSNGISVRSRESLELLAKLVELLREVSDFSPYFFHFGFKTPDSLVFGGRVAYGGWRLPGLDLAGQLMRVLGHAAVKARDLPRQPLVAQALQRLGHLAFAQRHDGIAI